MLNLINNLVVFSPGVGWLQGATTVAHVVVFWSWWQWQHPQVLPISSLHDGTFSVVWTQGDDDECHVICCDYTDQRFGYLEKNTTQYLVILYNLGNLFVYLDRSSDYFLNAAQNHAVICKYKSPIFAISQSSNFCFSEKTKRCCFSITSLHIHLWWSPEALSLPGSSSLQPLLPSFLLQ